MSDDRPVENNDYVARQSKLIAKYTDFECLSYSALERWRPTFREAWLVESAYGYLPLEHASQALLGHAWEMHQLTNGYVRGPGGDVYITTRTAMPGVTGKMVQWWFAYCDDSAKHHLWHPQDHVSCWWKSEIGKADVPDLPEEYRTEGYWLGRAHCAVKYTGRAFGGGKQEIELHYERPESFGFTEESCDQTGISALFIARILSNEGLGTSNALGRAHVGWVIHAVRETYNGCEMSSNFWLGKDIEALPPDRCDPCRWNLPFANSFVNLSFVKRAIISNEEAGAMCRQCYEEMHILSEILRELFMQEAPRYWTSQIPRFVASEEYEPVCNMGSLCVH